MQPVQETVCYTLIRNGRISQSAVEFMFLCQRSGLLTYCCAFCASLRTQGDPIRIRHSHSPRSYRQYRRSQCSDGERSVLSEVKYVNVVASNELVQCSPEVVQRSWLDQKWHKRGWLLPQDSGNPLNSRSSELNDTNKYKNVSDLFWATEGCLIPLEGGKTEKAKINLYCFSVVGHEVA